LGKSYTEFTIEDGGEYQKIDYNNFGVVNLERHKDGFYINKDYSPTEIELTTVRNNSIGFTRSTKRTAIHVKINLNK
jgi:hypothetical protein